VLSREASLRALNDCHNFPGPYTFKVIGENTAAFLARVVQAAVIVLGLWFAVQLMDGASTPTDRGGVAYWAHIGGFLAGMALIPFFKRPGVPLFAGPNSQPFAVGPSRRSGHLPPPMR